MLPSYQARKGFWSEAIALQGSVTTKVLPSVILCGVTSLLMSMLAAKSEDFFVDAIALDISPFGFAGAVLGIVLVIRLNAGYDRWWEARTLWGGIVNQSRNLAISALAFGPRDQTWREQFIGLTAAFPYSARDRLRGGLLSVKVSRAVGLAPEELADTSSHRLFAAGCSREMGLRWVRVPPNRSATHAAYGSSRGL
jgi:putative membrane protein